MHYETVSEAIEQLRKKGFTLDFNLGENCINTSTEEYFPEDFEIVDVYRYEGDSDPADEASVYALESISGLKGLLVTGYGPSEGTAAKALEKMNRKKN
jgi:hypothetical protein